VRIEKHSIIHSFIHSYVVEMRNSPASRCDIEAYNDLVLRFRVRFSVQV